MGLFSKKTVACSRCGKEYQVRFVKGKNVCDECLCVQYEKEQRVRGYVEYAARMGTPTYTVDEMENIDIHRNSILEKNRQLSGISRTELQINSDNYKKLSEDEVFSTWSGTWRSR